MVYYSFKIIYVQKQAKTCLPPSMLSSSSIARLSASLGDQAKKDCLVLQIFSQEQMSSEMSSCCSCYVFSQ